MRNPWKIIVLVVFAFESALLTTAAADTVSLAPKKDNTIYSESERTNGGGQHFFAGFTVNGDERRSIISFDVATNVPAGATIHIVTLTLNMSRTQDRATPITVSLYRCLDPWGEGTVMGERGEGFGGLANPGDATWSFNAFGSSSWSTRGGHYDLTVSGSTNVSNEIGFKVWNSTPGMVADVQSWLDSPQTNFGWMVIAAPGGILNAKRFDSRENVNPAVRPVLQIDYTPPIVADAGTDAGQPDSGLDAGMSDAGVDAGTPDAGGNPEQDAGTGSPNNGSPRMSSGCQTAPGSYAAILGLALLALNLARRRRQPRLERSE